MTRTILDALSEAEKAATPGPWTADPDLADYDAGLHNVWHPLGEEGLRAVAHDIFAFEDAALIALLRNHAADLIAVARAAQRARVVIRQGQQAMDELLWTHQDVTAVVALEEALAPLLADAPEEIGP